MFEKKEKIIIVTIVVILLISLILYFFDKEDEEEYIDVNNEIANLTNEEIMEETEEGEEIILHVIGAVKNPGIVKIKEGSRIVDVIEAAGGITEDADQDLGNASNN